MRLVAIALVAAAVLLGCTGSGRVQRGVSVSAGDAEDGRRAIVSYGCGSCHEIPGVANAHGDVGPPLTRFGNRGYIAGELANNQENLVRWIVDPKGVEPGTAMPQVGVTHDDAVNISAYLESLH